MSASPLAQERINNALRHIQAAQDEMGRACAELSTLRYGGPAWKVAGKLYDKIHAFWYRVRALPDGRYPITTDSEAAP